MTWKLKSKCNVARSPEEYKQWIHNLRVLYENEPGDLTAVELKALKEGGYID